MIDIFVFGSNEKGIHGCGSALHAVKKFGAIPGQGVGLQGRSYAIPTKATPSRSLQLMDVEPYVEEFLAFAAANQHLYRFFLAEIGTNHARFTAEQMAPLFRARTPNVLLPYRWLKILGENNGKDT